MTDRIAELRALRGVVFAYIDAYMASHASGYLAARDKAEARLAQEADKSLDALLDCAEALTRMMSRNAKTATECADDCRFAEAALARLNGDDHAG